MIVDTSALIAILYREQGYQPLREAILGWGGLIPAPARVEYRRVATSRGRYEQPAADELISELLANGLQVEPFGESDAELASAANAQWGTGNGRGGTLNLLDLMVYAVAKGQGMPILCTGRDFALTDADIHPASRTW